MPHRCVHKYENTSEKDRTSTADSGTMPFGWTNTSRESGRNVGAASMHEPCANRSHTFEMRQADGKRVPGHCRKVAPYPDRRLSLASVL